MPQTLVEELSARHAELLQARQPMDAAWADLADHFLPTRFKRPGGDSRRQREKLLNEKLVDSTGILAMRTLAAGLQGGMTSPARPWFQLTLEDGDLARHHGVKDWLNEVTQRMMGLFHRSNFYNAVHTLYGELGAFGTAFMMELANFAHGFRFIPFSAGEYCLDTNARQRVDVVFRRFNMTPRQLVQEFGEKALPSHVSPMRGIERKYAGADMQHTVVHAVFPRNDRVYGRLDAGNKAFASVYWLEGGGDSPSAVNGKPHLLRESGFDGFPGFGVRWDVAGNAVYGRSPAMDVLPDCRMLQQMGITTLKAIHKAVDPPMNVSAGLKAVGLDLTPGGVNYVEAAPGQAPYAATPLLQIRPEIQASRAAILDVQNQIRQGLYNDLFRMLMGVSRSRITAREIAAREEEKLVLIGPVLERLHDEMFIPLISRTFSLMVTLDMLKEPPPEISGADFKIEFISLLAQAQKMVSTSAVDQFLGFAMNAAQAFPEALDAVNIDKVLDNYGEYLGVGVDMIRPLDDREKLRKPRADAQAAQARMAQGRQTVEGLRGAAGAARDLSRTAVDGGNALDALLGAAGGIQ